MPDLDRALRRLLKATVAGLAGPQGIKYLRAAERRLRAPDHEIREIVPVRTAPSGNRGPRLNLVLPGISDAQRFGGISTALGFFEALAAPYEQRRIIVLDAVPGTEQIPGLEDYRRVELGEDPELPRQVISTTERSREALPIAPRDLFVCSSWWTAYAAQRWVGWQARHFAQARKPIVYLIQDYEPGFYPWSARSVLAESTYTDAGSTIAVFNTELLRQFFADRGIRFQHQYSFEPRLNRALRDLRSQQPGVKQRKLLVYGRPSIPRNAFPLLVAALRIWAETYPEARSWTLLSAGEAHSTVRLGNGVILRSGGKLSLPEYAWALQESAVGLSWMVSPHPSYPPLEMAHHGLWVLTNRFANKDLSLWHDNIVSLDDASPESIARSLAELCRRVEQDPAAGWQGKSHLPHYLSDAPAFPFLDDLREVLDAGASAAVSRPARLP